VRDEREGLLCLLVPTVVAICRIMFPPVPRSPSTFRKRVLAPGRGGRITRITGRLPAPTGRPPHGTAWNLLELLCPCIPPEAVRNSEQDGTPVKDNWRRVDYAPVASDCRCGRPGQLRAAWRKYIRKRKSGGSAAN
jgi:hypothetical protein